MDKNAIKKYAIWARRELIERVSHRAMIYGITAKDVGNPNAESVNGHLLSQAEKRQRKALIRNITTKGYEQVMEEVAYTWFNRFAALRFMEVNGYLPSHIRVFTNDAGEFKPQILAEAIHLELEGLDMNKVYDLESANKSEELFKYLLIVQCNALNSILPGMFQRIEDYTELLLPDYLLREGSVIEQMVTTIPEEDWTDQVQIIGWLYQYYNTEPKDRVFADLKKKKKITKEKIPAATQLFTPDWIVHYMVENSLGRLWLEGHPNDALKSEWKFYLDEADQEPEVQAQLATIRKEYASLKPEEIRVIDPCMGSGHILCVLLDILVRIYEDYGYTAREAAVKIVENNLWGLDIDERAAQLSYFAVMMKARQYDRRFFTRKVQPHVYAIVESNGIDPHCVEYFVDGKMRLKSAIDTLIKELYNANEYGSILSLTTVDYVLLLNRIGEIRDEKIPNLYSRQVIETILPLIQIGQALTQKYHVTVTNPPYMGSSNMGVMISNYVKKAFPDSKSDLFAVFIERCNMMTMTYGYQAMITMQNWMFLSGFETLRRKLLLKTNIVNLLHLGIRAFEEIGNDIVQTASFVVRNVHNENYVGSFFRLLTHDREKKVSDYLERNGLFYSNQRRYLKIPGAPIAYWVTDPFVSAFNHGRLLGEIGTTRKGMYTGMNERFVRGWYEVKYKNISFHSTREESLIDDKKWYPYANGGDYRKWYGNMTDVVNWQHDGEVLRNERNEKGFIRAGCFNLDYIFHVGVVWTSITSSRNSMRIMQGNSLFSSAANAWFGPNTNLVLAFLNSKVAVEYLHILCPSINANPGDIGRLPMIIPNDMEILSSLVEYCIQLCKEEWDSYEMSWDFQRHPLMKKTSTIAKAFSLWENNCHHRFQKLKEAEEEINSIIIKIYGLQNELTPYVENRDITVRPADVKREVCSFISYAVGCLMGRYSLDKDGIVYAGDVWNDDDYQTFIPDNDGIIPICDDEYFEDDIVGRFVKFVEVAFGKATLEENLRFIADALGGKGSSREVIRSYFINDFYVDHLKVYQKRPIYWLFDSGKKNGFKCLIYMHRYQPDIIARIRTDYVHEQQSRYRTAIADLEQRINSASTSERVKLSKQLATLQAQAEEIRIYEEKIHHLADQMIRIDLDDGVKHNYSVFKDVLAKI